MFLIIHEDGSLEKVEALTLGWLQSWEEGLISIVKFENEEYYYLSGDDEWEQI